MDGWHRARGAALPVLSKTIPTKCVSRLTGLPLASKFSFSCPPHACSPPWALQAFLRAAMICALFPPPPAHLASLAMAFSSSRFNSAAASSSRMQSSASANPTSLLRSVAQAAPMSAMSLGYCNRPMRNQAFVLRRNRRTNLPVLSPHSLTPSLSHFFALTPSLIHPLSTSQFLALFLSLSETQRKKKRQGGYRCCAS